MDDIMFNIWKQYEYMQWLEYIKTCRLHSLIPTNQFFMSLCTLFYTIYFYIQRHWRSLGRFFFESHASSRMILSYNGKIMRKDLTLSDYLSHTTTTIKALQHEGITNLNTNPIVIHLSFALDGGCFLISFSVLLMIIGAVMMSFCTCGASLIFVPLLAPLLFILPFFCL